VGRPTVASRFVLQGILVGVGAAVFYIVLSRFQPEPLACEIAHGLELAGGAAGDYVAERRKAAAF